MASSCLDAGQQGRLRQAEVEAHHLRPDLLDDRAHGGVEGREVHPGRRERGVEAELAVVEGKAITPSVIAHRIGRRLAVAEEVHVDRLAGQRSQPLDGLLCDLRRHRRAAERAQAPSHADRGREFDCSEPGHWRQHDRMFDLQQVGQAAVRPCWRPFAPRISSFGGGAALLRDRASAIGPVGHIGHAMFLPSRLPQRLITSVRHSHRHRRAGSRRSRKLRLRGRGQHRRPRAPLPSGLRDAGRRGTHAPQADASVS